MLSYPADSTASIAAVLFIVCCLGILGSMLIPADGPPAGEADDEDVDRCLDCQVVLDDDNRAVTCGDHPLCADCDGDFNFCRVCRWWKRQAAGPWTVGPDPFLDYDGGL